MSSLWTPSGEHFPKKEGGGAAGPPPASPGGSGPQGPPAGPPGGSAGGPAGGPGYGPQDVQSEAEAQAAMDALRADLAVTPAEVVVANHCYGLFELAAIYLSSTPPMLFQARLAIDGLGALLDGLKGRLGDAEPSLLESISQLRLAFVSLEGAELSRGEADGHSNGG